MEGQDDIDEITPEEREALKALHPDVHDEIERAL